LIDRNCVYKRANKNKKEFIKKLKVDIKNTEEKLIKQNIKIQ